MISQSNKAYVQRSLCSCDNSFIFTAPKLWNILPNNVTSIKDFSSFSFDTAKFFFGKRFLVTFHSMTWYYFIILKNFRFFFVRCKDMKGVSILDNISSLSV